MLDEKKGQRSIPVRVPLVREPVGVIDSWQMMRRNVLSIIPEAATREKTLSGRTVRRWHMIMDPDLIREVLLERLEHYPKSTVTKTLLRPAIGDSLFISEGADWRWQRRSAAPAFSHRSVTALGPLMTAAAERSAARIGVAGKRAVNLLDEMTAATFEVIADVTFSADGSFNRDAVHRAIDAYIGEAGKISLLDVFGAPDWVPRPARVATTARLDGMKRDADRAIAARAARGPSEIPDLLDRLLESEDPDTGRKMDPTDLRDNLLTFIVAGHETTAVTLAWAFYLCAFDEGVQDRAREEARSVLGGRAATAEDLPSLPLVRRIIDESLRLYPPAGMVSRTAQADDRLDAADVRAGDTVMIPIYALGRHHGIWEDPDSFDPDRFLDRSRVPRFGYLPFGDGPRICIGASFALQEAVIILATLLSRFRFRAVKGRDPSPVMILTLRPEGGVWLMAEPV